MSFTTCCTGPSSISTTRISAATCGMGKSSICSTMRSGPSFLGTVGRSQMNGVIHGLRDHGDQLRTLERLVPSTPQGLLLSTMPRACGFCRNPTRCKCLAESISPSWETAQPFCSSTSERLEHVTAVSGGPAELHICRSARGSQSSPFRQKSTCHIVIFDFRQISSLSEVPRTSQRRHEIAVHPSWCCLTACLVSRLTARLTACLTACLPATLTASLTMSLIQATASVCRETAGQHHACNASLTGAPIRPSTDIHVSQEWAITNLLIKHSLENDVSDSSYWKFPSRDCVAAPH